MPDTKPIDGDSSVTGQGAKPICTNFKPANLDNILVLRTIHDPINGNL